MQFLGYLLLYPLLKIISFLPLRVLYILSDIAYVIIYKMIRYRVKVVRYNMGIALPHLSTAEQRVIEKKFYRHFCDSFFEIIKTPALSKKDFEKRFVFPNKEVLITCEAKGKSIMLLCAHYASYEWLLTMKRYLKTHIGIGVYKTLRNPYLNKLVKSLRNNFDCDIVDTRSIIGYVRNKQRKGIYGLYGFISDQSPKVEKATHWEPFFGVEVPVHIGGELIAKKFDMNVLYVTSKKVKRGYYEGEFVPFEGNVKETPNYEITAWFYRLLEQQILAAPEYYLWTHKRFKHGRNAPPFKA